MVYTIFTQNINSDTSRSQIEDLTIPDSHDFPSTDMMEATICGVAATKDDASIAQCDGSAGRAPDGSKPAAVSSDTAVTPPGSGDATMELQSTTKPADSNTDTDVTDDKQYSVSVNATAEPVYAARAVRNNAAKLARHQTSIMNHASARLKSHKLRRLIVTTASAAPPLSSNSLQEGPAGLIASALPSAFPPKLAYRALAAYSTIRSLSVQLRISPFTPNSFMRALSLPCDCELLGTIHVTILQILFAHHGLGTYHTRGDGLSKLKLPLLSKKKDDAIVSEHLSRMDNLHKCAGENLTYMDRHTWPLYYMDYVSIYNLMKSIQEEEEEEAKAGGDGLEDDVLGLSSPAMDALFRSQPSEIKRSRCEAPYKTFQWMEAEAGDGDGRRKRRKIDGGSSGEDADAYEPGYEDETIGKSRRGRKKRSTRSDDHASSSGSINDISLCKSEVNPRPVTEDVYGSIRQYFVASEVVETVATKQETAEEEDASVNSSSDDHEPLEHMQMDAVNFLQKGEPYYNLDAEMKLSIIE